MSNLIVSPMSTLAISLPRVARHNPLAAVGVFLVAVFVFSAVFAPWIAPQDPARIDLPHRLQTPSAQHWAEPMNWDATSFPA